MNEKLLKSQLDELEIDWEDAREIGFEEGLVIDGGECDILIYTDEEKGLIYFDLFQKGKVYPAFSDEPTDMDTTSHRGVVNSVEDLLSDLGLD